MRGDLRFRAWKKHGVQRSRRPAGHAVRVATRGGIPRLPAGIDRPCTNAGTELHNHAPARAVPPFTRRRAQCRWTALDRHTGSGQWLEAKDVVDVRVVHTIPTPTSGGRIAVSTRASNPSELRRRCLRFHLRSRVRGRPRLMDRAAKYRASDRLRVDRGGAVRPPARRPRCAPPGPGGGASSSQVSSCSALMIYSNSTARSCPCLATVPSQAIVRRYRALRPASTCERPRGSHQGRSERLGPRAPRVGLVLLHRLGRNAGVAA